jgi:hypothetical protein
MDMAESVVNLIPFMIPLKRKTYVILIHILCFAGLMPYNFLTVQAGEILGSLTSVNELIKVDTFIKITVMACVALGPGLYLRSTNSDVKT